MGEQVNFDHRVPPQKRRKNLNSKDKLKGKVEKEKFKYFEGIAPILSNSFIFGVGRGIVDVRFSDTQRWGKKNEGVRSWAVFSV